MATGRWPAAGSPGWWWTPLRSSATPVLGRQVSELRVVAERAIDAPAELV